MSECAASRSSISAWLTAPAESQSRLWPFRLPVSRLPAANGTASGQTRRYESYFSVAV